MFCTFCFAVFPFIKQQMESVTPTRCFWNPALCLHRESLLLIGCIFFSPPSIRQSYRKWWVRRKLRMFPPHPLPLLNLLRVKHQSPQQHRYNTLLPNLKLTPSTRVSNGRFFFLPVATNWKERKHPTCWVFIKLAAYFFHMKSKIFYIFTQTTVVQLARDQLLLTRCSWGKLFSFLLVSLTSFLVMYFLTSAF